MARTFKISGGDGTAFQSVEDAVASVRAPLQGKRGSWLEHTDSKGDVKVTFVGKQGKKVWTIRASGKDAE